jgi:hypothetical protein
MSTKSVAEKLLIKKGDRVLIRNEPIGYRETLGPLPEGASIATRPGEPVDLIQVFVTSMEELKDVFLSLKGYVKRGGLIWVTYPKGTSQFAKERRVDVSRDAIAEYAREHSYQAVAMVSVDDTWSALRLKAP